MGSLPRRGRRTQPGVLTPGKVSPRDRPERARGSAGSVPRRSLIERHPMFLTHRTLRLVRSSSVRPLLCRPFGPQLRTRWAPESTRPPPGGLSPTSLVADKVGVSQIFYDLLTGCTVRRGLTDGERRFDFDKISSDNLPELFPAFGVWSRCIGRACAASG